MSEYKIRKPNRRRKQKKHPKHKMRIDNRNIFQLEEIKKKKRDQILKKKRRQKEKERNK
jgi:hypothetical protein